MKETVCTKIKICGLTRECDIAYVNEAMPDYIGFVFAPSRRRIGEEQAKQLRAGLDRGITAVGVFVDAPQEQIMRLLDAGIIDAVQLHGSETPEYVEQMKGNTRCPVIKALRPEERDLALGCLGAYERAGVDGFLFDSGVSCGKGGIASYGGTGKAFDWRLLPDTALPCFLAGGLNMHNIEEAVSYVRPYAVDISSGVETDGAKDRRKILDITAKIRNCRQIAKE